VLAHALDVLLRLLHPMIPFLTEEVWHLLGQVAPERGLGEPGGGHRSGSGTTRLAAESVCIAAWPTADTTHQDPSIENQFADFQAVLGAVREIRNRQNIPLKEPLSFAVKCDAATAALLEPMQPYFAQMAKATLAAAGPAVTPPDMVASVSHTGSHGPLEVYVDVSGFIDVEAERKRLEKQCEELKKFIASIAGKLANKNFVDRAPADVVDQQRTKLAELEGQFASVTAALEKLPKTVMPARRATPLDSFGDYNGVR
jgi:valyl-tRNA synthetase